MKLWQLISILRDSNIVKQALGLQRWEKYRRLFEDFSHYVEIQDRDGLDQMVDEDLCRAALEAWGHFFWVDNDGYLREYQRQDMNIVQEKLIPAYAAYVEYGGDILEEVLEKGCVKVN